MTLAKRVAFRSESLSLVSVRKKRRNHLATRATAAEQTLRDERSRERDDDAMGESDSKFLNDF